MAKSKTQFTCNECGHSTAKWLGRCPSCEAWNSLSEEVRETGWVSSALGSELGKSSIATLEDDTSEVKESLQRISTGISELDRVLGGGLVTDSFTLLGGDPGIGKSTLLLQMAKGLLKTQSEIRILYVSGEESVDQIRGRARRLSITNNGGNGRIFLAAETHLEKALASVKEVNPHILFIDSLQTFSTESVQSAPGSVSQVREITARLMSLAKTSGISVWLVGHITKEGTIAGPKTVEHMVDTVLYFEGEEGQSYRLLRAVKNRFGSTRELGVFEMDGEGLREVSNPSSLFLSERKSSVSGTAVCALLEGTRPILVELQALVTASSLAMPRRTAVGLDTSRLSLLAAILEKHLKLPLAQYDLFFNVVGGLRLSEPGCDLAAAAAIWSSAKDFALSPQWIFIGELGLTGEIRRVSQTDVRIQEAKRLGFTCVVIPESTPEATRMRHDNLIKIRTLSKIEELPKLLT